MAGVTALLKALANPNRKKVYQVIFRRGRGNGGITIERICRAARMKQPAVSHHVARLAAAGLVARRKEGWWVYCSPDREGLAALARFVRNPGRFAPEG
jgi:DNA-binding transcriptional ArsR family regulator